MRRTLCWQAPDALKFVQLIIFPPVDTQFLFNTSIFITKHLLPLKYVLARCYYLLCTYTFLNIHYHLIRSVYSWKPGADILLIPKLYFLRINASFDNRKFVIKDYSLYCFNSRRFLRDKNINILFVDTMYCILSKTEKKGNGFQFEHRKFTGNIYMDTALGALRLKIKGVSICWSHHTGDTCTWKIQHLQGGKIVLRMLRLFSHSTFKLYYTLTIRLKIVIVAWNEGVILTICLKL